MGKFVPDDVCRKCGLYRGCQTPCIQTRSKLTGDCLILFLGEAPGRQEDAVGKPFVGPSGELLNIAIRDLSLDGASAIGNIVRCRPKHNDKPSLTAINCCKHFTEEDIAALKPKVIVTLGGVPLKGMLDRSDVTRARGTINKVEIGGVEYTVIPTFHPAYALRNPSKAEDIYNDIAMAKQIALHGEKPAVIKKYVAIDSVEKAKKIIEKLSSFKGVAAVDVEGSGKNPFKKGYKLATFSFSVVSDRAYFVPCQHPQNDFLPAKWYRRIAQVLLQNDNIETLFHYGYHDTNAFRVALGIEVTNYTHDTILMHHLIKEDEAHDLDRLESVYLPQMSGHKHAMQDIASRAGWDMTKVKLDETMMAYNCGDADATLQLYRLFRPMLTEEGLDYVYEEVMRKGINVLSELGFNGIAIDAEAVKAADRMYTQELRDMESRINGKPEVKEAIKRIAMQRRDAEITKKVHALMGNLPKCAALGIHPDDEEKLREYCESNAKDLVHYYQEFKPNSTPHKQTLLYDVLKLPVLGVSKRTGKPSTDRKVLEKLAKKRKVCQMLNEYVKLKHLYGTYVKPAIPVWMDTFDGRSHCSYKLHVARTGRPSSTEPNHANIPRSKTNAQIKNFFVARPGYKLVQFDFSQMELRILACYSNDPTLIKAYTEGRDIHREFASYFYRVKLEDVTDGMRQVAKGAHFGIIYGMGAESLAVRAGCSVAEAQKLIDALFSRYPMVKRWMLETVHNAKMNKEVVSLIGRKRRLPDIQSREEGIRREAERQAVNTPIQGLATDMMLLQLYRINKYLRKNNIPALPLITVYDSILFEVREDVVDSFIRRIKPMIEDFSIYGFDWLNVPIVADAEVGERWGSLKKAA